MTSTHTCKGIVWLDLKSPTDDEISGLVRRYGLHPLVGEELKRPSSLTKIEFYDNYVFLSLTLPVRARNEDGHEIIDRDIDFVIGKNFLITSRQETIEQLEYFSKIFETNAILSKEEKIEHGAYLFYYMIKRIYAGMVEDLNNIKDSLIHAESRIFSGEEKKMVEVLSRLNRELIDTRQTIRLHREIWDKLVQSSEDTFFGGHYSSCAKDMKDEFSIIHELVVNTTELLNELRETNDSLLDAKQNEIIKTLTIITSIFYPGTFIASIFTIPAAGIPIVNNPYGWSILIALTVIMTGGMVWFFRKKRWI